ncbi:MAG: LCP family protein [Christensenellales bacterium]|jgi:putative cell envelope-related function transcriptional attenuator
MGNKNKKKKKNIYQKLTTFFIVIFAIGVVLWTSIYAVNRVIGEDSLATQAGSNDSKVSTKKKSEINALIVGTNQNLTDTMMYVNYNVETGKVAMMSIPRDTYITNEYCVGHKLNSLYRGKNTQAFVEQIEELIGVDIDYYLIFDSKMLIDIVDKVGGVEVDVPVRMKYDDPTQNLHIDLKKGTQVLNGKQAEQFVRYRKGNDGSGYARGDLQRTEVQQQFIKNFISTVLSAKNLTKIPDLINVALDNTDTNITAREALKYSTDVMKIDTSNISSCTAPGEAKYINNISYFVMDKEKTKELVKNKLVDNSSEETTTQSNTAN